MKKILSASHFRFLFINILKIFIDELRIKRIKNENFYNQPITVDDLLSFIENYDEEKFNQITGF
jgi:hypothetical protein